MAFRWRKKKAHAANFLDQIHPCRRRGGCAGAQPPLVCKLLGVSGPLISLALSKSIANRTTAPQGMLHRFVIILARSIGSLVNGYDGKSGFGSLRCDPTPADYKGP